MASRKITDTLPGVPLSSWACPRGAGILRWMQEIAYAGVALLAYVLISLVVGDRFPFSRYAMYAALKDREEGAVLYLRSGNRFLEPDEVRAVFGVEVDALDPKRVPCSQQWVVYEVQRLLRNRTVTEPPSNGADLEVGYRMLRVDEHGDVHETLRPITSGTASISS